MAGQAAVFFVSSGSSVVGTLQAVTAKYHDTLLSIAEEFELGYEELVAANPQLDSWLPGEGNRVLLPSKFIVPNGVTQGIYINLAEYRLYYFPGGESTSVMTFPISIGRGDWNTPVGETHVTDKLVNPAWYPPESIRREHAEEGDFLPKMVPPGPDNPLGDYALRLNLPGYLIHGTNRPYGIGMKVTHGCIRLRPVDIAALFKKVPREEAVQIVHKPFKAGVLDGVIYFEAHPMRSEVEAILEEKTVVNRKQRSAALTETIREVLALADELGVEINWLRLVEIAEESLGIPLPLNEAEAEMTVVEAPRRSSPGAVSQSRSYLF